MKFICNGLYLFASSRLKWVLKPYGLNPSILSPFVTPRLGSVACLNAKYLTISKNTWSGNDTVLIRLINAGLNSHKCMSLTVVHFSWVGIDGESVCLRQVRRCVLYTHTFLMREIGGRSALYLNIGTPCTHINRPMYTEAFNRLESRE